MWGKKEGERERVRALQPSAWNPGRISPNIQAKAVWPLGCAWQRTERGWISSGGKAGRSLAPVLGKRHAQGLQEEEGEQVPLKRARALDRKDQTQLTSWFEKW